ncbi:Fe-S cluster assembly protein SufD [archaeon]|nr:Fe-S cluster assembly protein SufD [archaeon]|tara:strand:- start:8584 stop:9756 length:1173 start_codon:yes stop_codon:yes gene_type:complete
MLNENFIKKISERNKEPKWLLDNRLDSFSKFKSLDKVEHIKHGLNILLKFNFDLERINSFDLGSKIIERNNDNIVVMDINKAVLEYSELIKENMFSTFNEEEKDKYFIELHRALFSSGVFIYVKKGFKIQLPIFENIVSSNKFSYNLIVVEDDSELTFIEDLKSKVNEYNSSVTEIIVGKNSEVNYCSMNNSTNGHNFNIVRSKVKENGNINFFSGLLGSGFNKTEVSSFLEGNNSRSNNVGMFFGDKEKQFDIYARSFHVGKNTKSNMFTKGIVKDKSKSVYRGLVHVSEDAIGTDGYQKEDILILNDEAEADSIPELEINNDDVKCSHGASISNVDKEKLFYLQSRGVNEEEGKKLIVDGFFYPLLREIKSDFIKQKFAKDFEKFLKK